MAANKNQDLGRKDLMFGMFGLMLSLMLYTLQPLAAFFLFWAGWLLCSGAIKLGVYN